MERPSVAAVLGVELLDAVLNLGGFDCVLQQAGDGHGTDAAGTGVMAPATRAQSS